MEIIILIAVGILGLIAIHKYIKVKDLEGKTERRFIEVERNLNMLERGIKMQIDDRGYLTPPDN